MPQALPNAWRASAQADRDFPTWAKDENFQGCTTDDTSDSNDQAATGPDNRATTYKKAVVGLWNPVAAKYGLTAYQ